MDDRQRELDQRIRRAQRQMLLKGVWDNKVLVLGGVALLLGLGSAMVWNATPDRLEATLIGKPLGDTGVLTARKGAQYRHETVQLANGATITLDLPGKDPVPLDAGIKVEVHEKALGPIHQLTYRFGGYVDEKAKT